MKFECQPSATCLAAGHFVIRRRRSADGFLIGMAIVAGLILLALMLGGCSSQVTFDRLDHLEKSLHDERRAVEVRPGFEGPVSRLRAAEDADIAALKSSSK